MAKLRWEVFERAHWQCENKRLAVTTTFWDERPPSIRQEIARCPTTISWLYFDLHHIIHRSRGGSDTPENCMALCVECHDNHHRHGIKAERWDM